jgi:hypothetical protein
VSGQNGSSTVTAQRDFPLGGSRLGEANQHDAGDAFDFPSANRPKLTYWSDVAMDSPDSPVRSEDERFEELTRMREYFKTLWDDHVSSAPKFDLKRCRVARPENREG